jgi:hypothetical protein
MHTHSQARLSACSLLWRLAVVLTVTWSWGCFDDDGATPMRDAGSSHQGRDAGSRDSSSPDTGKPVPDASKPVPDSGVDCELAESTFLAFVAANQSCMHDSDCAIIGDCGPNADFTPITVGAAHEGRELMNARCSWVWDGETYRAVCAAGTCTAVEDGCCYCQDAGSDSDAGA